MQRFASLLAVLLFALALTSAPALAGEVMTGQDHAGHKFVRGLSNAALGWTSYYPEVKRHGALGILTGTSNTITRTSVGAVELGLFYLPFPTGPDAKLSYEPLMSPDHPWQ